MEIMQGKSLFIWQVKRVFGGNIGEIIKRAREMRLSTVLIKAADGVSRYNQRPPLWLDDIVPPLVDAFRSVGIKVWGWQYIYGVNPEKEAERAIERVNKIPFTGWVVDAEAEFKQPGKGVAATKYMSAIRAGFPSLFPVGLTTYRYPALHREFAWADFLPWVDFNMPQVYWMKASNPEDQLESTLKQYDKLYKDLKLTPKPIYPIGAAFSEHGWTPGQGEIIRFHEHAKKLGLQSVSYWEWGDAIAANLEETVANLRWPGDEPMTLEQRVADLEVRVSKLEAQK